MIHTTSDIHLTTQEISRFREHMRKCVSKDFTCDERERLRSTRASMARTRRIIDQNNGGKNPILGY